jgi:hypothetical protein
MWSNCKLCGNKRKTFNCQKILLKSNDKTYTIKICDACSYTLETIRRLKSGQELKDDDFKED